MFTLFSAPCTATLLCCTPVALSDSFTTPWLQHHDPLALPLSLGFFIFSGAFRVADRPVTSTRPLKTLAVLRPVQCCMLQRDIVLSSSLSLSMYSPQCRTSIGSAPTYFSQHQTRPRAYVANLPGHRPSPRPSPVVVCRFFLFIPSLTPSPHCAVFLPRRPQPPNKRVSFLFSSCTMKLRSGHEPSSGAAPLAPPRLPSRRCCFRDLLHAHSPFSVTSLSPLPSQAVASSSFLPRKGLSDAPAPTRACHTFYVVISVLLLVHSRGSLVASFSVF